MSTQNYDQATQLLDRGSQANLAIAAAQTIGEDVITQDRSTLVVEVDMTGGAVGDLTIAVQPYEADNATLMPIGVPQVQGVGPTLSGGHVYQYAQFDVTGVDRVRILVTNNNVAGQTITRKSWRLS